MFDGLVAEVEALEVPATGDAIRAVASVISTLQAKLASAVAGFQAAGSFEVDGALTATAWLRDQCHLAHPTARATARAAGKLAGWPVTAAAWTDGTLAAGQVEVIVQQAGRHADRFAGDEGWLVPLLAGLSVDECTTAMRHWRAKADALDDGPAPTGAPSSLYLSGTIDGRGELSGSLDADLHHTVAAALREADPHDFELSGGERKAVALGVISRFYLDHHTSAVKTRNRPHINIVLQQDGSATYDTGVPVDPVDADAYLCDAAVHRVLVDGASTIVDYGRARRTVPTELFNALSLRDQGCRFPGCDRPASMTDAHHVTWWRHGGETHLANLMLACRRHHRLLHHPGWDAKLRPDGTLELTHPDGTHRTTHPPGPIPKRLW